MYSLWCEWDIGQEGLVFHDEVAARRWVDQNPYVHEILGEEDGPTLKELEADGLLGFKKLTIIY